MGTQRGGFTRQYRAALLDYLLRSRESERERAYELGRRAIELEMGLLTLLQTHQKAVNAVMEPTHTQAEALRRLKASDEFLIETLSPFEIAYRGYADLMRERRTPTDPRRRANHPNYRRPRSR